MTEDPAVFQGKSYGQEIADTGYTMAAFMGASQMRFHTGLNPATGHNAYYAKVDSWLADVERRGFTPYLTITYQPGTWEMPAPGTAETTFAAGFEAFCGNIAQRYNGRIMRFGVWNEPNNSVGGRGSNPEHNGQPRGLDTYPQLYSELYRRCYSAIKAVNSNMKVYYGEIDAHRVNPCTYVYNSLTTPMHTDGIAIHTYQWTLAPEQPLPGPTYTSCQGIGRLPDWNAGRQYWHSSGKLRTPQNGVPPIHITEHGYCASDGECPPEAGSQNSSLNESQRADFTRRAYLWAAAQGVQTFSYYHLFNQPSENNLWDSGIVSLGGVPSNTVFSLRQVTGSTRTTDTVGMFSPSSAAVFLLRNENSAGLLDHIFPFGVGTDKPVTGDWDHNGIDTAAVFRPSTGWWYQRNTNSGGVHDNAFQFGGVAGDIPVAGDWNGDGFDSIGVFRSSNNYWYLRNSNSTGPQDYLAEFGAPGDIPVAGDWNGDGSDSIGVFRPSTGWWYLRDNKDSGPPHNSFQFGGVPGDIPVVGDWNGTGRDTVGIFRPSDHTWHLRYANSSGAPNVIFDFGSGGDTPISGNWDGY
ncbi:MAG TPA: hypothetical protein VEW67_08840 [Thermoleophilaceae bacterium]|nr:hypothetical protein [Thermoleophilaceae bacterium]